MSAGPSTLKACAGSGVLTMVLIWKWQLAWISCVRRGGGARYTPRVSMRVGKEISFRRKARDSIFWIFPLVLIRSDGDVEDTYPPSLLHLSLQDSSSPRFPATHPSPVAPALRCWHALLLRAASTGAWAQGFLSDTCCGSLLLYGRGLAIC